MYFPINILFNYLMNSIGLQSTMNNDLIDDVECGNISLQNDTTSLFSDGSSNCSLDEYYTPEEAPRAVLKPTDRQQLMESFEIEEEDLTKKNIIWTYLKTFGTWILYPVVVIYQLLFIIFYTIIMLIISLTVSLVTLIFNSNNPADNDNSDEIV